MEHIKITSKDNTPRKNNTMVQVGGHDVFGAKRVDFRVAVDEIPTFIIETIAEPEIEMYGEISFKYHPRTIEEAARVLRRACARGSENYNALVLSIKSVVKEYRPNADNISLVAEAQDIADRILGIEN